MNKATIWEGFFSFCRKKEEGEIDWRKERKLSVICPKKFFFSKKKNLKEFKRKTKNLRDIFGYIWKNEERNGKKYRKFPIILKNH